MVVNLGLGKVINRYVINSNPPEKVGKWKNEFFTEYVVKHVLQHPLETLLGFTQ
jgi:hypothetical protein